MKSLAAASVLLMPGLAAKASAQCGAEGAKLIPPTGYVGGEEAGTSVCIDGDWAFVGAPVTNQSIGAVYIYHYTNGAWTYSLTLLPPTGDANPGDGFGTDLALTSDHLFVSSPWDDEAPSEDAGALDDEGAVYIYRRESQAFVLEDKVMPNGIDPRHFGDAISAWDDTLLVGEPDGDISAYVFRKVGSQWEQEAQLKPTGDPGMVVKFGTGVGLYQNTAVIGDYRYEGDVYGVKSGAAFVFKRTGSVWGSGIRIDHPGYDSVLSADDHFGESIAVYGRWIVIGAPKLGGEVPVGAVFVYRESLTGTFDPMGEILADDTNDFDLFGESLSIRANQLLIGSPGKEHAISGNHDSGGAYLFRNEGLAWTQVTTRWAPADVQDGDEFGYDVHLGSLAILGSRKADLGQPPVVNVGAAYLWQPCP